MIVLDLDKNQTAMVLDLTKDVPALKKLRGELNWDPHPLFKDSVTQGYDLDIFIFCLNAHGKVDSAADVIYFKNKWNSNRSIGVPVDNQTGEGEDDEFFIMDLENIPADKNKFSIYVFIHDAAARGQNFGMVANTRFDLINDDTKSVEVRYQVTQQFSNETCLHVADVVRREDGHFEVQPIGAGAVAGPNDVVQLYV